MLLNIHYMHLFTIWKPQNHKASFDAKRLNNLESSVIVAIFCKTTRIAYIWYKIRLSYILVRMAERSNCFLLQDPDGHWFEPWWGLLFFPFLNCILVFNCRFLGQMFEFINIEHLMTCFNTCQNLVDSPFNVQFRKQLNMVWPKLISGYRKTIPLWTKIY